MGEIDESKARGQNADDADLLVPLLAKGLLKTLEAFTSSSEKISITFNTNDLNKNWPTKAAALKKNTQ